MSSWNLFDQSRQCQSRQCQSRQCQSRHCQFRQCQSRQLQISLFAVFQVEKIISNFPVHDYSLHHNLRTDSREDRESPMARFLSCYQSEVPHITVTSYRKLWPHDAHTVMIKCLTFFVNGQLHEEKGILKRIQYNTLQEGPSPVCKAERFLWGWLWLFMRENKVKSNFV